jgi:hypothetical protein
MAKQRIEIEVDIPEGYEATGEYRESCGERYAYGGCAGIAKTNFPVIILCRKEPDAVKCARECLDAHSRHCSGPCRWCRLAKAVIADFERESK